MQPEYLRALLRRQSLNVRPEHINVIALRHVVRLSRSLVPVQLVVDLHRRTVEVLQHIPIQSTHAQPSVQYKICVSKRRNSEKMKLLLARPLQSFVLQSNTALNPTSLIHQCAANNMQADLKSCPYKADNPSPHIGAILWNRSIQNIIHPRQRCTVSPLVLTIPRDVIS